MAKNRQVLLAARPAGMPKESDFKIVDAPMPEAGPGQVLIQTRWLSLDPYMRGRMNDARSYAPPMQIGEVMVGGTVGEVVSSNYPGLQTGDLVDAYTGWQAYAVAPGESLRKLDPSLAPVSTALGILGMPGLTAYFGLLDIGQPKAGETVVVSAAAGAVGSAAGQIARIRGCRVVGTAGSDEKVRHVTEELGFDAAFNYKTTPDYDARLRELCPRGIDVYFDNVGGALTDAVLRNLNVRARVAICGQISQYNLDKPDLGPRPFVHLLIRQARAEGFLVFQFQDRYAEGLRQMAAWLREGKLRYREEVTEGLDNAPRAFIGMLQGGNTGKQLVKVS